MASTGFHVRFFFQTSQLGSVRVAAAHLSAVAALRRVLGRAPAAAGREAARPARRGAAHAQVGAVVARTDRHRRAHVRELAAHAGHVCALPELAAVLGIAVDEPRAVLKCSIIAHFTPFIH